MQATSKKELIINAFKQMDIEMLELLLNDNQTYQDARKDAFIEKLKQAFDTFKSNNESSLIALKGICVYDHCTNKGCTGYSFYDSNSKNHLDLIFEEAELDFNDIHICSGLKTNEKVEKANRIHFDIFENDKPNYKPSIETLAKSQLCEKAYNELQTIETVYIDKNDYLYWLERYKYIYDLVSGYTNIMEIDKFYWLYHCLHKYSEFLAQEPAAIIAINEYSSFNPEDEKLLLEWLVKYENLKDSLTLFLDLDYMDEEKINVRYIKLSIDYKLHIAIADFDIVYKFKTLYDSYYWDFLNKYTTFSKQQLDDNNYNKEVSENSTVLSYHLRKRGLI